MSTRALVPLAVGVFVAGSLDMAFAMSYWGMLGASPMLIAQSVAAGLLGPRAFHGGLPVACLGLALHYSIIAAMFTVFYMAALKWAFLARRPLLAGPTYGLVLYAVMNYLVVPLSAARPAPFRWSWVLGGIAAHMIFVGLTCAISVRIARTRVWSQRPGAEARAPLAVPRRRGARPGTL